MVRSILRLLRDTRGNVATVFALAAPVLLMAGAAAVDYSSTASDRSRMQALVDEAAFIGIAAVQSSTATAATAKQAGADAVQKFLTASSRNKIDSLTTDVSASLDTLTVNVSSATAAKIGPFFGNGLYPFSVTASAYLDTTVPVCLLALDKSASPGILFKGTGSFVGKGCTIWSNATSATQSIAFTGSSQVTAGSICAGGGVSYQGSAKSTPTPTKNCAAFTDPLASWQPASVSLTCKNPPTSAAAGTLTMFPGTYCGKTPINNTDVVLKPGQYVLNNADMSINGKSTIKGTGVQFILTGNSTLTVTAGTDLNLTGITDANGVQVLVAEYGTLSANAASFTGNAKLFLNGAVHLPSQTVNVTGNATVVLDGPASSIIAKQIVVGGGGAIQYPASVKGKAPQYLAGNSVMRLTR